MCPWIGLDFGFEKIHGFGFGLGFVFRYGFKSKSENPNPHISSQRKAKIDTCFLSGMKSFINRFYEFIVYCSQNQVVIGIYIE